MTDLKRRRGLAFWISSFPKTEGRRQTGGPMTPAVRNKIVWDDICDYGNGTLGVWLVWLLPYRRPTTAIQIKCKVDVSAKAEEISNVIQ